MSIIWAATMVTQAEALPDPVVTLTEPASGASISGAFTVSGTIEPWTYPGIVAIAISYIGGVEQEAVPMALTSPPGGWSAAMSFPGDGAGAVEVTFFVDGMPWSDSVPVSFIVM